MIHFSQAMESLREWALNPDIDDSFIIDFFGKNGKQITFCPLCEHRTLSMWKGSKDIGGKESLESYLFMNCSSCDMGSEIVIIHTCTEGRCSYYPTTHNKLRIIDYFRNKEHQKDFLIALYFVNDIGITPETWESIMREYEIDQKMLSERLAN